jgi:hypothetical protein
MTWSCWVEAWRRARRDACLLTVAATCAVAFPQKTFAAQVQAYAIFEIGASSEAGAAADKLRSTSLANCLQLIVGRHARDVFVHIACDEQANTNYLGQAFLQLSGIDGIARANFVLLKRGAD